MELSQNAIQRLTMLANYMDRLQVKWPDQFNMKSWGESGAFWCGTKACAAGWGCTMPEFAALGLRVTSRGALYFDGYRDMKAAQAFFELGDADADHLFGWKNHDIIETPQQWAKHCRSFLTKHGVKHEDFQRFMSKAQQPVKVD